MTPLGKRLRRILVNFPPKFELSRGLVIFLNRFRNLHTENKYLNQSSNSRTKWWHNLQMPMYLILKISNYLFLFHFQYLYDTKLRTSMYIENSWTIIMKFRIGTSQCGGFKFGHGICQASKTKSSLLWPSRLL